MIFYQIYASESIATNTKDALLDILEKSRTNNIEANITGMLLYMKSADAGHPDRFMQLLEGKFETVKELYETIDADPRHKNCIVLQTGFSEVRAFPEWSMGLQQVKEQDTPERDGLFDLSPGFLDGKGAPAAALRLSYLKSFYDISP